jgi:hypothetical protein
VTPGTRIAVVPCPPALLPRYAGLADPLHDLRTACLTAVSWLVAGRSDPVLVLCPATVSVGAGGADGVSRPLRLAEHLLSMAGHGGRYRPVVLPGREPVPDLEGWAVLVLADGSARRSETAPGYVDERAFAFDAAIGAALEAGDAAALRDLDVGLGADLLAEGAPVLRGLATGVDRVDTTEVTYDDDPFGVQYWVATWLCRPMPSRPVAT